MIFLNGIIILPTESTSLNMKIYLDNCCLNRPFDDQRQPRIRLEAEAVTLILEKVRQREWSWIGSEVLVYEIQQTTNTERKERLLLLAGEANQTVDLSEKIMERAEALSSLGFGEYDALHLASAESAKVDVFLTTDDPLLSVANRNKKRLSSFIVSNPVKWLEEVLKK